MNYLVKCTEAKESRVLTEKEKVISSTIIIIDRHKLPPLSESVAMWLFQKPRLFILLRPWALLLHWHLHPNIYGLHPHPYHRPYSCVTFLLSLLRQEHRSISFNCSHQSSFHTRKQVFPRQLYKQAPADELISRKSDSRGCQPREVLTGDPVNTETFIHPWLGSQPVGMIQTMRTPPFGSMWPESDGQKSDGQNEGNIAQFGQLAHLWRVTNIK